MSYDIFPCRYVNGEPAPLDRDIALEVLGPYVTARDPEGTFLQLAAGEYQEADVYLGTESSFMISHFGGERIMDLISELLQRLEAVLLLPGGTVLINRDEDGKHLPPNMRDEWSVVVASTGEAITRAIRAS
ncbi:hypothetical protein [Streptomyces sp. NPDC002054]|uniref:hypothetical protein n=1 Tax=Streptomyces sp. NPDC002054 TaxID=3154663 RepID=UPI0033319C79